MTNEEQRFRLAAKACGKDLTGWGWESVQQAFVKFIDYPDLAMGAPHLIVWNPRDDDGDSRRLQVDARIDVVIYEDFAQALHIGHGSLIDEWVNFSGTDKHAATRLAVLNCAVATGGGDGMIDYLVWDDEYGRDNAYRELDRARQTRRHGRG